MPDPVFDYVIVGGGAAGSAAALSLLQAGVSSVCIIESSDFAEPRVGETIPPDTNLLLSEMGVARAFADQAHLPCYGSHSLWGSGRLGHNDFLTSPYGNGWHLDRSRFDRMLLDQAVARGATHVAEECTRVHRAGDRIEHVEAGGRTIAGQRFIDATGRGALLLRALGVSHRFDDRQTVIWARFRVADRPLGNATWLEAAPNGWWYAAELPGDAAIVALGTDPRLAKSGGLFDLRAWAVALSGTVAIAPRLSRAQLVPGSFRVTASHSYLAERIAGENWVAVGDAASAFDPLSSAGIYKALMTGQSAARAMIEGRVPGYADRVRLDYSTYLAKRRELYLAEQHWPEAPFWRARHGAPSDRDLATSQQMPVLAEPASPFS